MQFRTYRNTDLTVSAVGLLQLHNIGMAEVDDDAVW